MRITSSEIRFASAHSEFSRFVQKETITERIRRPDREGPMRVSSREATDRDRPMLMSQRVQNPNFAEVSDRFEGRVSMIQRVVQEVESHRSSLVSAMEMDPEEGVVTENFEMSVEDKARVEMVIKAVVEQITGKKIDLVDPGKALKEAYESPDVGDFAVVQQAEAEVEAPVEIARPVREVRYHFEESY